MQDCSLLSTWKTQSKHVLNAVKHGIHSVCFQMNQSSLQYNGYAMDVQRVNIQRKNTNNIPPLHMILGGNGYLL